MGSANDQCVTDLVNFIQANKQIKEHPEVPVFFGGDANVQYYGGEGEKFEAEDKIKDLQSRLAEEGLEYTLAISNHVVRKRRPSNFFNNAQAGFKRDVFVQETMFFAFPTERAATISHPFDDKLESRPTKVADAFAGADRSEEQWDALSMQIEKDGHDTYLHNLLLTMSQYISIIQMKAWFPAFCLQTLGVC